MRRLTSGVRYGYARVRYCGKAREVRAQLPLAHAKCLHAACARRVASAQERDSMQLTRGVVRSGAHSLCSVRARRACGGALCAAGVGHAEHFLDALWLKDMLWAAVGAGHVRRRRRY